MRLLTAISVASLAVSIAAVVFVLGLYAELEKSEPKEHTQELTESMVSELIFANVHSWIISAGITPTFLANLETDDDRDELYEALRALPGYGCLWYLPNMTGIPDVNEPSDYMTYNYIKQDDTWLVTGVFRHPFHFPFGLTHRCEEMATWSIDDNTGEVTYGRPDEK